MKLINDIRLFGISGSDLRFKIVASQISFRWLWLLRSYSFKLPNISEVHCYFHQDSLTVPRIVGFDRVGKAFYRKVQCSVNKLPDSEIEFVSLVNECIYKALLSVCDRSENSLDVLERVLSDILTFGDRLLIPRAVTIRRNLRVSVGVRFCGDFYSSGEYYVMLNEAGAGREYSYKLLSFCDFYQARGLVSRVSMSKNSIVIYSSDNCENWLPNCPEKIVLPIDLSNAKGPFPDERSQAILDVERSLMDHDVPW